MSSKIGVIVSDNTNIFQDFFRTHQWPDPTPVVLRLYHDEKGRPIKYTCDHEPGAWIEVSPEQYARASFRVLVKDGQLIDVPWRRTMKLRPSDHGTACACCDVCVIVSPQQPNQKWSLYTYES
jgi:hypothetical protein